MRADNTIHYSDEPSACTTIIFIQGLALPHRAQVSIESRQHCQEESIAKQGMRIPRVARTNAHESGPEAKNLEPLPTRQPQVAEGSAGRVAGNDSASIPWSVCCFVARLSAQAIYFGAACLSKTNMRAALTGTCVDKGSWFAEYECCLFKHPNPNPFERNTMSFESEMRQNRDECFCAAQCWGEAGVQ